MNLTVGQLKNVLRMLDEGEPRMTDDSPVSVDFLNHDDIVMGALGGAPVTNAYWSIDEEALSLVIRTDKRIEL